MTTTKNGVEVKELSFEEAYQLLDRMAQRELKMSAGEFLEAWYAGRFDDNSDRPEVMRVAMLLPFISK